MLVQGITKSNFMRILHLVCLCLLVACSDDDDPSIDPSGDVIEDTDTSTDGDPLEGTDTTVDALYFPPIESDIWETTLPDALGWNQTAIGQLDIFLEENNTKAFIILKDGKMVMERYYQDTDATTSHRWNSAAKTLTALTVGIAQQEEFLSINDASSDYLGNEWTSMTADQESQITIKNHLTMTTGGDYTVPDINCTDAECLLYLNEASTEWYYHNAYYTVLQDVVAAAVQNDFNSYYDSKIKSTTGITGAWIPVGYFRLYFSTARSMARFGLLNLNEGNWDGNQIINSDYFTEMTTPSQDINKAYGNLWWLNGQESFKLPTVNATFPGKLIATAPDDLIAGIGKDDQKLYVVPSEGLVVMRLGDAADASLLGPSGYDTDLWEKIMEVID